MTHSSLRIVTGADKAYFYFAQGLVLSILKSAPEPRPDLGFLDLGCSEGQLEWLRSRGVDVVAPDWDFEFSGSSSTPVTFRAMTARPFLPRYFPGAGVYLWIDSDAWVQDWGAVRQYEMAARAKGFAVTPEVHRCYAGMSSRSAALREFMTTAYRNAYDNETAERFASYQVLNTGVCAYREDSQLRERWIQELPSALSRTRHFMVELVAFNHALYSDFDNLYPDNVGFLPAGCNWMCHQCPPMLDEDRGVFCEPAPPYDTIGILHRTTDVLKRSGKMEVPTRSGKFLSSSVEFEDGRYSSDKPVPPAWQDDSGWAVS